MRRTFILTLAGLLLTSAAFAQPRKRGSATDEADQKELYNYVLTMDKIQKVASATKSLNELAKAHPDLKSETGSGTLDGTVQKLQEHPEVVAVLGKNGLTPREYTVGMMTLIQASMAVGMKKTGTYKDYPPDMLKLVSKTNLDLVDQHYDQIKALTESLMQRQ